MKRHWPKVIANLAGLAAISCALQSPAAAQATSDSTAQPYPSPSTPLAEPKNDAFYASPSEASLGTMALCCATARSMPRPTTSFQSKARPGN